MDKSSMLKAFSGYRLGGEDVPDDVKVLLAHADELENRTGVALNWKEEWTPWLDTSYLTDADRANPDIAANVRAIAEVCKLIAFIAASEEDEFLGYWRGPDKNAVANCPLVCLDNEGEFEVCRGSTFAEVLLGRTFGEEEFAELRDWLRSLGIVIRAETADELTYPQPAPLPRELHERFYRRCLAEAGRA